MKIKEWIEEVLERMTYTSRHQKELELFKSDLSNCLSMEDDEFLMQYLEINARYEHKKVLLSTISIAFITSILIGVWKYAFEMVSQLLTIKGIETSKSADVIMVTITVVGVVIIGTILLILVDLLRELNKLTKEKAFLEEVKKMRARTVLEQSGN